MKTIPTLCGRVVVFLCYLGDILAVCRFCKEYMKISLIREKWLLILFPVGRMAIDMVYAIAPVSYLVYRIAEHVFLAVLLLFLFQGKIEKKIVVWSLLLVVRGLLWDFSGSFFSGAALFLHHVIKGEAEPLIQLWWEECIICGLTYVVEIIILHWLAVHRLFSVNVLSGRHSVAMAVPFFLFILIDDIVGQAATKGIVFRSSGNWGLYYDQLFSHAGACVLAVVSMLAAGFYTVGMERVYLEQKKRERYYAGIMAYKAMEEQYHQMERLRHDMKNHLLGMQGMIHNREWDQLEQYVNRMLEAGAIMVGEEATGNNALDAMFFYKRKLAEEKNIVWECDVQVSTTDCPDVFDLCVLFGNILDNAIEACERLPDGKIRFINIKSKRVKKCFLLEVKNSTDLEKIEEIRDTHKENSEMHGIGIQNIEDMVNRYHGVLEMGISNEVFRVSVLLPLVT